MKLLARLTVIFDRVINLMSYLACVLLVFVMLAVSFDVSIRYIAGRGQLWLTEISEYILLYITFLVGAWVLKREGHVRIDVVLNLARPGIQAVINIITSVLCTITCLALTWYGAEITWDHFQRGVMSVKMLELPLAPIMLIIPVGFFLLFIQFLKRTYSFLKER